MSGIRTRSLGSLAALLTASASLFFVLAPQLSTTNSESIPFGVVKGYAGSELGEDAPEDKLFPLRAALLKLDRARAANLKDLRSYLDHDRIPLVEFESIFDLTPRYVWEYGSERHKSGVLVFERYTPVAHPGSTPIRLTFLAAPGDVRARSEFTTGWRCYFASAQLKTLPGFEYPVIVVQISHFLGPDVERQYYALVGNRFDLVMMESTDGAAVRNGYWLQHGRCGPEPPRQSEAQWEADLQAHDRARNLRALVWLAGHHILPLAAGQKQESQMEAAEAAGLVRRVRMRPEVVKHLRALAEHGRGWEKELAGLALNPEDVRWF